MVFDAAGEVTWLNVDGGMPLGLTDEEFITDSALMANLDTTIRTMGALKDLGLQMTSNVD